MREMCKAIEFPTPLLPPLSSLVFHLNSAKAGLSAPLSKSSFLSLDSSFIKKKKKVRKEKAKLALVSLSALFVSC